MDALSTKTFPQRTSMANATYEACLPHQILLHHASISTATLRMNLPEGAYFCRLLSNTPSPHLNDESRYSLIGSWSIYSHLSQRLPKFPYHLCFLLACWMAVALVAARVLKISSQRSGIFKNVRVTRWYLVDKTDFFIIHDGIDSDLAMAQGLEDLVVVPYLTV